MILAGAEWGAMTWEAGSLVAWLVHNVVGGTFEEVLFRGVCFHALFRAWGHTRAGLFKAAVVSSLLFGPLHLLALLGVGTDSEQVIASVAQAIYAALLGVGFVGLVVYTRSLLPSVAIHAFINASGSISRFLVSEPAGSRSGPSDGVGLVVNYGVVIVVIFVIATLPAILYLKNGELFSWASALDGEPTKRNSREAEDTLNRLGVPQHPGRLDRTTPTSSTGVWVAHPPTR